MGLPERKDEKFALRVTSRQKEVIEHAARLKQTTITSFIVDRAYEAAEEIILDQRHFTLTNAQWEAFSKALDAPPKDLPGLSQLMSEPDIWED